MLIKDKPDTEDETEDRWKKEKNKIHALKEIKGRKKEEAKAEGGGRGREKSRYHY